MSVLDFTAYREEERQISEHLYSQSEKSSSNR